MPESTWDHKLFESQQSYYLLVGLQSKVTELSSFSSSTLLWFSLLSRVLLAVTELFLATLCIHFLWMPRAFTVGKFFLCVCCFCFSGNVPWRGTEINSWEYQLPKLSFTLNRRLNPGTTNDLYISLKYISKYSLILHRCSLFKEYSTELSSISYLEWHSMNLVNVNMSSNSSARKETEVESLSNMEWCTRSMQPSIASVSSVDWTVPWRHILSMFLTWLRNVFPVFRPCLLFFSTMSPANT